MKRLVARVEVVVNNFRPGVMERFGLGYEDLRAVNPAIVYGSATGFGPLGPMAGRPGVDIMGQAMGGIMTKTGDDGGPPTPAGAAIADQTGAILLAVGTLAALLRARATGEGEQVDVSLYGSQIALQSFEITTHSMLGRDAGRGGLGHPEASKRGIWRAFEAADGWFVLGSVDMHRFQRLSKLVSAPELSESYPDDQRRAAGLPVINAELERRFREQPRAHWFAQFEEQDIIFAPVQSYDDVLASEQGVGQRLRTAPAAPRARGGDGGRLADPVRPPSPRASRGRRPSSATRRSATSRSSATAGTRSRRCASRA